MSGVVPARALDSVAGHRGAPLLGRQRELGKLGALWDAGERLITLLGPGGIGKTRLALEWARLCTGAEVVLCELDGVRNLDELLVCAASKLGIEAGSGKLAERIAARLRHGAPLLVLDGFERLVSEGRNTVRAWLDAAPGLRCIVTSRRAIGLEDETRLELSPLDAQQGLALFMHHARHVSPEWAPAEAEHATVRAIVGKLDGLPLAIKLCARRSAVLSAGEMLVRLDRSHELVSRPSDEDGGPHTSLRAVLDASWELLPATARNALALCSVFRGGFTSQAAEAVFGDGAEALRQLQLLREHSLIRVVGQGEPGRPLRFDLFQTVREYADEKLQQLGQHAEARDRAARYFAHRASEIAVTSGAAREQALRDLRVDRENLVQAVEHLLEREPTQAVSILLALHTELQARETSERHCRLLGDAVCALRATSEIALLAQALAAQSEVLRASGQLAQAARDAEEAVELAKSVDDHVTTADALRHRGEAERCMGRVEPALVYLEQSLALARSMGHPRLEAQVWAALANAHYVRRDLSKVEAALSASHRIWAELREPAQLAFALCARAVVLQQLGRLEEARPLLEEALASYRQLGHRQGESRVLGVLAEVAWEEGSPETAAEIMAQAIEMHEALGAHPWIEMELSILALISIARGRPDEGLVHARRAEECMGNAGFVRIRALALMVRGAAEAAVGSVGAAEAAFSRARQAAAPLEPLIGRVVDLAEGMVDVARAVRDQEQGAEARANAHLARAHARLGALAAESDSPACPSFELRAIGRLLRAALAGAESEDVPSLVFCAPAHRPEGGGLVVGPGASWFSPPGGERVALDRRAWCRVLDALVQQRIDHPGQGLSADELFAAGWPGEKASEYAAHNRLWVALSGLRRRGLKTLLVRFGERYHLDASTPVRRHS